MRKNIKRCRKRKDNKSAARAQHAIYQPTAGEQEAVRRQIQRSEGEIQLPPFRLQKNADGLDAVLEHQDPIIGFSLLREAFGTTSDAFAGGLICQLGNARSAHGPDLNFAVSVIKSVKPNDQLETMLAAQMAVTHMAMMEFASKLARANSVEQCQAAECSFNKLARTYVAQMEALKRYRTGGEQKVTVQHVSVTDGGQAIVGDVVQAPPPGNRQLPTNAKEALTDAHDHWSMNMMMREVSLRMNGRNLS
jgi:hypothetical protein